MDREMVITHLQIIHTWAAFARERNLQFFTAKHLEDIAQWAYDAIAILEEQKTANLYKCPNCGTWVSAKNVVRCKDCKFWYKDECSHLCAINGDLHPSNWYCADGERK